MTFGIDVAADKYHVPNSGQKCDQPLISGLVVIVRDVVQAAAASRAHRWSSVPRERTVGTSKVWGRGFVRPLFAGGKRATHGTGIVATPTLTPIIAYC